MQDTNIPEVITETVEVTEVTETAETNEPTIPVVETPIETA